tara:strand:+ start:178 stop:594 length:417 start_codon:yes stop_codon:yes gene_type:complete
MEKYLYFRKDSTLANDDDSVNGSNCWPAKDFRGLCVGSHDAKGAMTGSSSTVTLFFTPQASTGAGGDADDAGGDNVDMVLLTTTDFAAKDVAKSLVDKLNEPVSKDNGFVVVFDAVTSETVNSSITAISTVRKVANAD